MFWLMFCWDFFKMSHLFSKCSYLIGVHCWIRFSTHASISKVQSCTGCQNMLENEMGAQLPVAERWQALLMWEVALQGNNTQGKSNTQALLGAAKHGQKPGKMSLQWEESCFWRPFNLNKNKTNNIDISYNMSGIFSCLSDTLCTGKRLYIKYIIYM